MIHLKSCLTGEAAAIVSSFQATDSNYQQAWDMVVKRYSDEREIIFAHIRKLDELKPCTVETTISLRTVADTINETVRCLANLKVPVNKWDLIIIYMALKKLHAETRKQWNLHDRDPRPTVIKFIEYLGTRAKALADSEYSTKVKSSPNENKKSASHVASSSSLACPKCSESHHLHKCRNFVASSVADRKELVSKKQLCYNCLFPNHSVSNCKMEFSCRKCSKRHHTLLHFDSPSTKQESTSSALVRDEEWGGLVEVPKSVTSGHCIPSDNEDSIVLMGTVLVRCQDSSGTYQVCRVFVDSGSESNFITEHCVNRLGLTRKKTCVSVSGISGSKGGTATGIVKTILSSKIRDFDLTINALIIRKISNKLPRAKCNFNWPHLQGLELGDPSFNTPGDVDILLGAANAVSILIPGIKNGPDGSPSAQNTQFGWMLSGCVKQKSTSHHLAVQSIHSVCFMDQSCIEQAISKFWELEEPEIQQKIISEEDEACEAHFKATHSRKSDGSYQVELPFKNHHSSLGQSRASALQRFLRVERRLFKQPGIKKEYIKCMRESISSQFMELIPPEEVFKSVDESYYMPHKEVVKESSSSTKVRIVYDASAKTSSGQSLNDILMTGPKLQVDLVPLLIKFRSHRVAMSADIVKFYPQFHVSKKHVDFQRLVWREDPADPIQDYRMLRITFGVTSAPYLAIRCLQQLADDEALTYPRGASTIKGHFLVDNLLSGADDVESALSLQVEILQIMDRRNPKLRKWSSNCAEVVNAVPPEHRESEFPLTIQEDEALKTIGILWYPGADKFGVSINEPNLRLPITKRKVLSSAARTFDPLGWLSPVTVTPKIIMQLLWKEKLDWDTQLSPELTKMWTNYCSDVVLLRSFRLSRCLVGPAEKVSNPQYELHGFSDASLLAYAACVYLKTVWSKRSYVNLIISKTKVSHIKTETIPRLELCAAALLARLIKTVQTSLQLNLQVIRCWTDSTIVLDWLKSSKKLPVFVANQVRAIRLIVSSENWFHVDGAENPADAPSRGISASKLLDSFIWLSGPSWLASNPTTFVPEGESSFSTQSSESSLSVFINKTSSYSRVTRVVAYVRRFIHNCKNKQRWSGRLQAEEVNQALKSILSAVQMESFAEDISRLHALLPTQSKVKFLMPFLDSDGLLRVGGRLQNSSLCCPRIITFWR